MSKTSSDEYTQLLASRRFLKYLLSGNSGHAFIPREIEDELSLVEYKLAQIKYREEGR